MSCLGTLIIIVGMITFILGIIFLFNPHTENFALLIMICGLGMITAGEAAKKL